MTAKVLFACCFFLIVSLLHAQQPAKPAGKRKLGSAQVQMVHETAHDTCLDKKFSIVYYIIQDSIGSKTVANTATLTNGITSVLNTLFARICVQFENCSTVIIPVHPFNEWTYDIVEKVVTSSWYTPNTMNVYIAGKMEKELNMEMTGYAHAPNTWGALPSTQDIIVLSTKSFQGNDAGATYPAVAHIVGHYFGLADTFGEVTGPVSPAPPANITSYEFVRRNNCASNGDGICDTDADCYPLSYYPPPYQPPKEHCYFLPGPKDGQGDYYTPPLDNYMSMYNCRCRFTQQQYNHMAKFILKYRMNLH